MIEFDALKMGDVVWFMHNNRAVSAPVVRLEDIHTVHNVNAPVLTEPENLRRKTIIHVYQKGHSSMQCVTPDQLFRTKADLLKSL